MPTVPVAFTHGGPTNNGFGNPSTAGNWLFDCSYVDSVGVLVQIKRLRIGDPNAQGINNTGYSTSDVISPVSFLFGADDIYTTFPLGTPTPPATMADAYKSATMTYPDSWGSVNVKMRVSSGGNTGWTCIHEGPQFVAGGLPGDLEREVNGWQAIPDPETLPSEVPFGLSGITDWPYTAPPYPENEATSAVIHYGAWQIINRTTSPISLSCAVIANFADGATGTRSFNFTIPAAVYEGVLYDGVKNQELRVLPILNISTKRGITADEDEVVPRPSYDKIANFIHWIPRFDHAYNINHIDLPTLRVEVAIYGKSYPASYESRPVANFTGAGGVAIDELEEFVLDGSRSFDLVNTITKWIWEVGPLGYFTVETSVPTVTIQLPDNGPISVSLVVESPPVVSGIYSPIRRSKPRIKTVAFGGVAGVVYDEDRLTWWHLSGNNGNLTVSRHLKHEPPGATVPVVLGVGGPGAIVRAGAYLFVTSKAGLFYASNDEGQTWSLAMPIAENVTLIAMAVESDGSTIYHLVQGVGGALQRVVLRHHVTGWIADAPDPVVGLPSTTRRPGAAQMSGATILLTAKSDAGVFAATSKDGMRTWDISG